MVTILQYTSAIGFNISALQKTSNVKSKRFFLNALAGILLLSRKSIPHQHSHLLMNLIFVVLLSLVYTVILNMTRSRTIGQASYNQFIASDKS